MTEVHEVELDGWTLALIAGSWLQPDGDGFEADTAGDVWVRAPDGRTATISWMSGVSPTFERMLGPRAPSDLGAFEVGTLSTGPTTMARSRAFLAEIIPPLQLALDGLK